MWLRIKNFAFDGTLDSNRIQALYIDESFEGRQRRCQDEDRGLIRPRQTNEMCQVNALLKGGDDIMLEKFTTRREAEAYMESFANKIAGEDAGE